MRNCGWILVAAVAAAAGCGDDRRSSFVSAGVPGGSSRALPGDVLAPPAAPREVEEADIVKSDGAGHLFALSPYRGLQILDVAQPAAPRLLGRAPILGSPVELYLAGDLAYVIVSDHLAWSWDAGSAALTRFHGSQVLVIDIADRSAPRRLAAFPVDGFVTATRRVGQVIYVVSNLFSLAGDLTFVASIDVADPADLRVVGRLDFPGSANQIHATADWLFVAQPRWEGPTGETRVQLVDISDPSGEMRLGGSADVPGFLDSKLQMDARGDVLRILTHDGGWGPAGAQHLSTYRVAGGRLSPLGALDLPRTGGLFGVRFDVDRAYFATFVTADPLEIVDLADPARPSLMASLEIDGTVYQIIPRGDRLLTLGTSDGTWRGVQVSLFDVADAARPRLLSSVAVGGEQAWTQAFWDERSLQLLDDLGLVAVPFQAWSSGAPAPEQGLQLVSFTRDELRTRGHIAQPGAIQRTIALGRRLGTLSDLSFVTCDVDDPDHPALLSTLELARNVVDLERVGAGAVQLLAPADFWLDGGGLRLRTVEMGHLDDGSTVAELALPGSSGRLFAAGDLVTVVSQSWARDRSGPVQHIHVVDVADLARPRLRASLELPIGAGGWAVGSWGPGSSDDGVVLVDGKLLAFLVQEWSLEGGRQRLLVVDLSRPDSPAVRPAIDLGTLWGWGLLVLERTVYLTQAEPVPRGPEEPYLVRNFMARVDLADPAHPRLLPRVNIPGMLVAVRDGGRDIFTVDSQWAGQRPTNRLVALGVQGNRAYLERTLAIEAQIGRVRLAGDHVYLTTQPWYWDDLQSNGSGTTLRVIDAGQLRPVAQRTLDGIYTLREVRGRYLFLETGGFWWWSRPASGQGEAGGPTAMPCSRTGCAGTTGESLAAFDLADPAAPVFLGAARVNGWILDLVLDGARVYLPTGLYGVQELDLGVHLE